MYETSAMFLHLVFSTNVFYLKERLANLFLPHASLSSRGGGNWCWQQVYLPAVAGLTHLLSGLYTLVKQRAQHYRYPTSSLDSSEILLFTSVSCTNVSVKPLFIPVGDMQSEVRMPSAVPWAPLASGASCVASSRWPGERETLFWGPTLPLLRRVSKVIRFSYWGICLCLYCL